MFFIAATFCYCHKYALFPGQRKFKHAYQQNIFVTQLQYLVEDNKFRFSSLGFDVHCSYAQFYAQRLTKTQINILTHSEKGLSHGMRVNRKTVEMIFLLPLERKKKDVWDMVDPLGQVVLIKTPGPDGDRPVRGSPMVPCLLRTKTPQWKAPVS